MRTRAISFMTLAGVLALAAGAFAAGTELHDVMKLSRTGCSITINPRDHQFCAGSPDSVTATVSCGPGAVPVRPPDWFLDGAPIGSGFGIRYVAGEGGHTLSVRCASCTDQIAVTALPATTCAYIPNLVAAFADSASESTTGIFQSANIAAVTPSNFSQLKFLMRPVTLTGALADDPAPGVYVLRQTGANLQVFRTSGTAIALPDTIQPFQLPLSVLVNATGLGTSTLILTYEGPAASVSDSIRVRVGEFPGLAGKSLSMYPGFEFMRSVNDSSQVKTAIDPTRHAERIGLPYRIYVVAHRTPVQWAANNALVDVSGGFETGTVTAGSITANTRTVWAGGLDGGTAGTIGKPYDVVYDFGLDGTLDPGDLVDGLDYNQAGFYVVRSLTLAGNHPVTETYYSGGVWLDQDLYYPSDIASMGQRPLIVISHGNGHNYQWYDYLGYYLASYGYIVMAHSNNTGPGIPTAAATTLTNTDYLLGNLATLAGGALRNHVDTHKLIWVGHSRGGEGVCYAYDRIWDHSYTPINFGANDLVLIRSMAPTVFYLPTGNPGPDPHDRNYDLLWGQADWDVGGYPDCPVCECQRILEHASGNWFFTLVQGATHDDWHSAPPVDPICTGCSDLIGQQAGNTFSKTFLLAELEWYTQGNVAAKDYMTHLWDDFRTTGVLTPQDTPPGVVAMSYHEAAGTTIIDDYQANPSANLSSSGGAVSWDVSNLVEGELNGDANFDFSPADPMNGCENMEDGDASQRGVFFDWSAGDHRFYEEAIAPGQQDFTARAFLSLRACEGTQHPEVLALNGPAYFTVVLRDTAGRTSAINTQAYGGITRPYQRADPYYSAAAGWTNEWSTIRIRLADFENDNSQLDLGHIAAVRLEFGSATGSARGRLGLDQIELTGE